MDPIRRGIVWVTGFVIVVQLASANVAFHVHHKFGSNKRSLNELKIHDANRHQRILAAAELPLGGDGSPTSVALYFTKIQIGSPAKDYIVQVDTGSDVLWVNCIDCKSCPKKSGLGVPLTLYDPKASSTSKTVTCDDELCSSAFSAPTSECKVGMPCSYKIMYGDGSSTAGYLVKDHVQLVQASTNHETKPVCGNVTLGCGSKQSGQLGTPDQALDGIVGFGQANSSLLSQLAKAKKVKKVFSHCLDGSKRGGGLFTMGEVVEPKVKSTPMAEGHHYSVKLKAIDVDGDAVKVPKASGKKEGALIDSGTTLAYFPEMVYTQLMEKIMAAQPDKKPEVVEDFFRCYKPSGKIDDDFPDLAFHFEDSVSLKVCPHQYFFEIEDGYWCIGFLNSDLQQVAGGITVFGDSLLSDKLVTYDLEKKAIGWTDHDCSSSIKVKDEESGTVYEVKATSSHSMDIQGIEDQKDL